MPNQNSDSGLRQAELVLALSLATDLGTGRPLEYAIRSTLLGVRLGEALGLSDQQLREVYHCALLLYIGCTSEVDLALRLFGTDPAAEIATVDLIDTSDPKQMMAWMIRHLGAGNSPLERLRAFMSIESLMTEFKRGHCEVAVLLSQRLGFEASIQAAFAQMYERWDGEGSLKQTKGEQIALPMRIALFVRDIEAHLYQRGIDAAISVARARAGSLHDPHVAARFCDLAHQLCASLEDDATWDTLLALETLPRSYVDDELDEALTVLADFIDLVSPYFVCHSRNVAALVADAARAYGLPAADSKAGWRAALVHDLGKVAVPFGLWEKARPLRESEWERVRLHPYYTERIMARPALLARYGECAALHHERADGSGYHRGLRGSALPPAACILAAANFYQARVEPRAFREALPPEAAADVLRREVRAGHLDSDAVKAVLAAAGHRTSPVRQDRLAGLTEREIEVLRLIARGLANRLIAQQLTVSEKTVETHVMHIYEKIHVSTRSAATLFAMQHHLIDV